MKTTTEPIGVVTFQQDYQPGPEVLVLTFQPNNTEPWAIGSVHVNGTITFWRNNYDTERIQEQNVVSSVRSNESDTTEIAVVSIWHP